MHISAVKIQVWSYSFSMGCMHAWSDITLQLLDVRVGLDALHIIGRAILRFFNYDN